MRSTLAEGGDIERADGRHSGYAPSDPLQAQQAAPFTAGDAYPRIGDYAVIGDCQTIALISRQGSIEWLCLPEFSSPSMFAAILDRKRGGHFAIRPSEPFETQRSYVGETNVLETCFTTASGRVRITDFMPVRVAGDADLEPEREIIRIVEGIEGETEIEVLFQPRLDYGRIAPRIVRRGTLGWFLGEHGEACLLRAEMELQPAGRETVLTGRTTIRAGQKCRFALAYTKYDVLVLPVLGEEADQRLSQTIRWWSDWSGQCKLQSRHKAPVMRSMLALKLLTCSTSGAVVAAATSSLPEAIGAGRNYDYRYCWLRDAWTTLRSFFGLGFHGEGEDFLGWLLHSTRLTRPELRVVYDIFGRTDIHETCLDYLEGYRGSKPIRIGNRAVDQLQLDVYGTVIFGAATFLQHGGSLEPAEKRMLRQFGQFVVEHWREPDDGLWEIEGGRRHYVHSKLMCWVAMNCLIAFHESGEMSVPVEDFRRERAAIAQAIETQGFDEHQGSYVGAFGETWLDASVLVMAHVGYKDPNDPRLRSTYERIHQELGRHGLLQRYPHGVDRIPSKEGTFGICTFWAVELLAMQGRIEEANELFERMLAMSNDVGLLSEEFDVDTGEALGNFPQAYTHAGLISAALALDEAERRRRKGAC